MKSNIVEIAGSINFQFILNFNQNEKFLFYMNDTLENEYSLSGEYNKTVILQKKVYYFKWKYIRNNSSNKENGVYIKSIMIKGDENGLGQFCTSCTDVKTNKL